MPACKETLYSQEGTTQGDALAMLFYGCAIMPLFQKLKNTTEYVQEWYADDASSLGKLTSLKKWLEILQKGPAFGYFPEPTKSYLIVDEGYISQAKTFFEPLGVNVVSGHRYLGSFIGSKEQKSDYLRVKADEWSQCSGKSRSS